MANSRQISLSQLGEKMRQLQYKLNRLTKLREGLNEKVKQGELAVLLSVRCNFALKEIVDEYWYFFLNKDGIKIFKELTLGFVEVYRQLKSEANFQSSQKDEIYVFIESLKHQIQSLIRASLRINALSEKEVDALELGDITPQESETVLTFLASKKKWDWVYKNLA
ncbi:hypothetical protein [aff. Roholtiella sp. LEGE 12411]|uniref:hypothetical protein n=1 Tax=aff. Roholtiella sp. LEGE 12411 TaxID=1828822 RepID=UPI001FC7EB4F|nr:hypothetical protein [aff. Roholtiella sp. LEGE 12411]